MKKNIFLIVFTVVSFAFSANAQSCCSTKAKDKSSCSKKTATTEKTEAAAEVKAVFASNKQMVTDTTEQFIVYGNCGMCKRTIESSLHEVEGITAGEWDVETHVMTVSFNEEVITLEDIKQKIANVGYDSETHRATEKVYNALHGCCQYERPE